MPIWCEECHNWKPDRTHHDSHTGRCVCKMDHFCPWVGGIISATMYKYYVQFLFYGFVHTGYIVAVVVHFLVYVIHEDQTVRMPKCSSQDYFA